VSRTQGQSRIGAGGFPIPVKATLTRASSLDESTDPKGCDPGGHPLPPNCGRKTKAYKLAVYGVRSGGPGFSYNFSSGFSTRTPEDPFTCPIAEGGAWWGRARPGVGKVSVAKLFNRGISRIVVKNTVTRSPKRSSSAQGWSSSATETLSWTLTLTRRG
jgi:hypothetical protein